MVDILTVLSAFVISFAVGVTIVRVERGRRRERKFSELWAQLQGSGAAPLHVATCDDCSIIVRSHDEAKAEKVMGEHVALAHLRAPREPIPLDDPEALERWLADD